MYIDEIRKKQRVALYRLLKLHDHSKKGLAQALGVTPNTLYGWFSRGRISALMAIKAELITSGAITKSELRPDVIEWVCEE